MSKSRVVVEFLTATIVFLIILLLNKNEKNNYTPKQALVRTAPIEQSLIRRYDDDNENNNHHRHRGDTHSQEEETRVTTETTITLGDIAFDQGPSGDKGEYVCVTMDWWPANKCNYGVCPWKNASILTTDLTSPKLQGLLKGFGGIILRIGGTQADTIVYQEEEETNERSTQQGDLGDNKRINSNSTTHDDSVQMRKSRQTSLSTTTTATPCLPLVPSEDQGPSEFFRNGCLTRQRWRDIAQLANKTNTKIIFAINAMFGRKNTNSPSNSTPPSWSLWHPHNAKLFFEFIRDEQLQDYFFGFEFGNELAWLWNNITAEEQAMGFHQLYQTLLAVFGLNKGETLRLLGPDYNPWNTQFYSKFIPLVQDILWGVTWHAYPLGAGYQNPHLEQHVLDPRFLDTFGNTVAKSMSSMNHQYAPPDRPMKLIMGETGGAYNSGNANVNNRFMDAFWYLHAMGRLAQNNHSMFCRQALVGGNYELIDKETHLPNPSYYAALLFKRIMGRQVRNVNLNNDLVRVFAHCNLEEERLGILIINYNNTTRTSTRNDDLGTSFVFHKYQMSDLVPRDEYIMTAPSILSRSVMLNNKLLPVSEDGSVDTEPRTVVHLNEHIIVGKQSYAFVQFAKDSTISKKECGGRP